MHIVLKQIVDVAAVRTVQEPQQLIGQAFEKHGFRGQQRKIGAQVEAHLLPEQRYGAGARAVGFQRALSQDLAHQILVGHGDIRLGAGRNAVADIRELL